MKQPKIVVGGQERDQVWFSWSEVKALLQQQENDVQKALEALDSMDDFCRMDLGVDPIGPRTVLENFINKYRYHI